LYFFLLQFQVIKTLEPYPDPDSLEMLDPDRYPNSPLHNTDRLIHFFTPELLQGIEARATVKNF
jgi:hypothetical protein